MVRLLPIGNQILAMKRMPRFRASRLWTPRCVAQSFLTRLFNYNEQPTFLDVPHEAIFVQYFCWKKHLKCDTITIIQFTLLDENWPKCVHSPLIKFLVLPLASEEYATLQHISTGAKQLPNMQLLTSFDESILYSMIVTAIGNLYSIYGFSKSSNFTTRLDCISRKTGKIVENEIELLWHRLERGGCYDGLEKPVSHLIWQQLQLGLFFWKVVQIN